jgi:uncharacterized protein (DUF58 family)
MKNLPAIASIATVAVLLLLAVAASLIDSLPFAFIASYVVGFGCSIGLLAMFISDYGPSTPRPLAIVTREVEERRALEAARAAAAQGQPVETAYNDPITVSWMSTLGLQNDPATVSLL